MHEWVLGLPWVVERPPWLWAPGIRAFAVDCEPLGLRRLWLVTGFNHGLRVAVVVPAELGEALEIRKLVRHLSPMPAGHVVVSVADDVEHGDIETVILGAYSSAMASELGTNL
jgi:hypothetical protein